MGLFSWMGFGREAMPEPEPEPAPAQRIAPIPRRMPPRLSERLLFQAAEWDQFNANWLSSSVSINDALYWNLRALRARSREMEANNPYFRRWLQQGQNNIIGPGIRLQSRARKRDGTFDKPDNALLEAHFRRWSRPGQFDVTGRLSRWAGERLIVNTLLRDGEFLIRLHFGYPNAFRFAVQFLDVERLDINYNDVLPNGNSVTMGVEKDPVYDRPVAYHLLTVHPDQLINRRNDGRTGDRIRIDARFIIHGFLAVRAEQDRGIPASHAAILALRDLGEYRQAAIINARAGANKIGWWKMGDGDVIGDRATDPAAPDNGQMIDDSGPGDIGKIYDPEAEFVSWNPSYPHEQFESFNKAMLQGISAGLGAFYPTLNHDYAGVNLSSIRGGLLDEREGWRALQYHVIEQFHEALFPRWLMHQMAMQFLPFPAERFSKFDAAVWKPRGWESPDPIKDAEADGMRIAQGLKTRRQIVEERGGDWDETVAELAEENAQLEELGLPLYAEIIKAPPPAEPAKDEEDLDKENEAA